jgi:hypothetical protein
MVVFLSMEGRSFLAEDPQLREAETEASGRPPGTPVQSLATITHSDGICATRGTAPSLVYIRNTTTISTAADTTTESGGISA